MKLSPTAQRFILHWGEMGSRWGINRTVAQIYALLYISSEPLCAEEIATTLKVARSNVSTSLRELHNWDLIRTVHVLGDRRDHFACMRDVWEMLAVILDERKRREIDPMLEALRECVDSSSPDDGTEPHVVERLKELLGVVETMDGWYTKIRRLPLPVMRRLIQMGDRIARLVR